MKINILFLFTLMMLLGCSCSKAKNIKISKSKDISIPLAKNVEYQTNYINFFEDDDKRYITYFNKFNGGSLIFFDWNKRKEAFRINKIGTIDALCVVSLDSIFYVKHGEPTIVMTDSSGNQKDIWYLKKDRNDTEKFECYEIKHDYYKNKAFKLFIDLTHNYPPPQYFKYPKLMIMNIDTSGEVFSSQKAIYYPKHYWKEPKYLSFYPSYTINNINQIVVSFEKDHKIYVYDSKGKLIENHSAKSKFIDFFEDYNWHPENKMEHSRKYQTTTAKYYNLVYDKYRDVYYRIVSHSQPYKYPDGTIRGYFDRSSSIIVLDNNFDKVDELYLEAGRYLLKNVFVNEEGLWISNNTLSNPSFDEHFLKITLFEIQNK